jgi:hypothetical protein
MNLCIIEAALIGVSEVIGGFALLCGIMILLCIIKDEIDSRLSRSYLWATINRKFDFYFGYFMTGLLCCGIIYVMWFFAHQWYLAHCGVM